MLLSVTVSHAFITRFTVGREEPALGPWEGRLRVNVVNAGMLRREGFLMRRGVSPLTRFTVGPHPGLFPPVSHILDSFSHPGETLVSVRNGGYSRVGIFRG